MKKLSLFLIITIALSISLQSCKKEQGCTDVTACNYSPSAEKNDGSCTYTSGCTDVTATNYNSSACIDDGSCNYVYGCTDASATNYNPSATSNDGSCTYDGEAVFWQKTGDNYNITTVTVNGISKDITLDKSLTPNCWDAGTATFTLDVGTASSKVYSFTAKESGFFGKTWSGIVTVYPNGCKTMRLL